MKINTALILCAGYGKRLNPETLKIPKPLLKLKSITMLEHCIRAHGCPTDSTKRAVLTICGAPL